MTGPRRVRRIVAAVTFAALPIAGAAWPATGASATPVAAAPSLRVTTPTPEVGPNTSFPVIVGVDDAPAGGELAVDLYDRISDASDLQRSTTDTPDDILATFPVVALAPDATASQTTGFTIDLYDQVSPGTPWSWRLVEPGVYPLRLRLRDAEGQDIATLVTFLIRTGDTAPTTTVHVATVARVDDGRTSTDVGAPDTGYAAKVGRLVAGVAANDTLPMTFAVDPGTATALAAHDAATTASLRRAIAHQGTELLAAPLVPVDPSVLVANGLGSDLEVLSMLGAHALDDAVGSPGTPTWLLDTPVDPATSAALAGAGVNGVVAHSADVGATGPTPPVTLESTGATLDAVTDDLVAVPDGTVADPSLLADQLVARAIAAAQISDQPVVATSIVLDPARTDPDVIDALLARLAQPSSILTTTTVDGLLALDPAPRRTTPSVTPTVDLGRYTAARRDLDGLIAGYRSMADTATTPAADTFTETIARSTAADLDLDQRIALVTTLQNRIRAVFAAVSTAPTERVTLGARNAEIPLSVTSRATTPLQVRIQMSASERLDFPHNDFVATVNPNSTTVLRIPVRTRTTGDTPMTITVFTPAGDTILSQTRYTVRSTAVSGVGLVLTIGAAGFLALWWGRHLLRAGRARRRSGRGADHPDPPGASADATPAKM